MERSGFLSDDESELGISVFITKLLFDWTEQCLLGMQNQIPNCKYKYTRCLHDTRNNFVLNLKHLRSEQLYNRRLLYLTLAVEGS